MNPNIEINDEYIYREYIKEEKNKIQWVFNEIKLRFKDKKFLDERDLKLIISFEKFLEDFIDLSNPEVYCFYYSKIKEIDLMKRSKCCNDKNCSAPVFC